MSRVARENRSERAAGWDFETVETRARGEGRADEPVRRGVLIVAPVRGRGVPSPVRGVVRVVFHRPGRVAQWPRESRGRRQRLASPNSSSTAETPARIVREKSPRAKHFGSFRISPSARSLVDARAPRRSRRGCWVAMTKFSVIVPTYNERRNIGILYLLLRDAFAHPSLAKDEFEIVIVDDNSPDGTQDVVRALQKTYKDKNLLLRPRPGKLGLGTAYVHGLNHASGEYVIIMDADLSHHPRAIPEFVAKQRDTDADVVTGTRYVPGGGVHGWDTRRKLTSRVANYLAHVLLSPGVSDLTGSFRLYRRDALERMVREVKSKGYVFQMEIIVRCKRAGLSVEEVPITFVDRVYGASKLGGAEIVGYLKGLIRLTLTT